MAAARWKLLGVFGLSACGFAVLAEPSCRTPGHIAQRQAPQETKPAELPQVVAQAVVPAPLAVPVPLPMPVPEIKPLAVTTPAETPVVTLPTLKLPVEAPEVKPAPVPVTKPSPVLVPEIKEPLPTYSGPLVTPERFAEEVMKPATKIVETKTVTQYQVVPVPVVVPTIEVRSAPVPTVVPVVNTTRVVSAEAKLDKNLKLNLTLSETNPKFEIRDGDDVLIKASADQMDVKSGQQKGEVWSSVKATGSVRFTTPGGEGICSELNLNHATGEIKAINAKFTHHWGKVETTVQSDVLTFKLTRQGSSFAVGLNEGR